MILLDTDVMVDIVRGHPPAVAWLQTIASGELAVPGYVAMELIAGCRTKADQEFIRQRLNAVSHLWIDASDCDAALGIFSAYRLSHSLGLIDSLIGQVALSHGLPLHTFNQKHFAAIPGLRTVQPYQK